MDYKSLAKSLYPIASGAIHPQLNGIYHTNGTMVASNSKILVSVKFKEYPETFEGLCIGRNSESITELHGDYPGYESLFTKNVAKNSSSKTSEYIFAACYLLFARDPDAALQFDDISLRPSDIIKVMECIYLNFQESTQILFGSATTPVQIKSKSVTAFIMPLIDVLDYYTPEEVFNLYSLKND